MGFQQWLLRPRYCHGVFSPPEYFRLFAQKRPTKGGSQAPQDPPPPSPSYAPAIWGNGVWYRCPWRNIHLTWSCFNLQLTVACVNKPCPIVLYVNVKLSRNQSWVNLLFSVSRDSILDSIEFSITCNGLSTYLWTVLYLLNIVMYIWAMIAKCSLQIHNSLLPMCLATLPG